MAHTRTAGRIALLLALLAFVGAGGAACGSGGAAPDGGTGEDAGGSSDAQGMDSASHDTGRPDASGDDAGDAGGGDTAQTSGGDAADTGGGDAGGGDTSGGDAAGDAGDGETGPVADSGSGDGPDASPIPDATSPDAGPPADGAFDAASCLKVGDPCTAKDCCGVGLACVAGVCSTSCAAYGHVCSVAMPCCMAPPPNKEVCNSLGYCQTI